MIPAEMTHYASWLVWRLEDRDGKPTKVPYSPRTLLRASVREPSHWATYSEALHLLQSGHGNFNGLGFVLSDNDPYSIIDLDDPSGDEPAMERARKVLEAFDSYTELSQSGNGFHIVVRGKVDGGRRRGKIECYGRDRFFAMTGNAYRETSINPCDYYLMHLFHELGGTTAEVPTSKLGEPQRFSDEEVYTRASETNEKFLPLWQGKFTQWYSSQSEADIALVNIISFYSRNVEQIARMFHLSDLGKRKKAHRKDYLDRMIQKSFDNQVPDISLDQLMGNIQAQIDAERERQRKDPPSMLGEGFALPPGLVGELARFLYEAAQRPVQEIALAGAIGLMAGICGRAYNVSNTGLNQYIILFAKTGRGKEAIKGGISQVLSRVTSQIPSASSFLGPGDIASGQALVKFLGSNPCFVSVLGEFGLMMQNMCSPHAPAAQVTLRKVLLDLYNKSGITDTLAQTIYSDKANNTSIVKAPALTIIGETTPESFFPHLTEDIVSQGLLPRFLCIEYSGKRVPSNKSHHLAQPSDELTQGMLIVAQNALTLMHRHQAIKVKSDAEATAFLEEFDKTCDSRINSSDSQTESEMWNRAHMKTIKLAALIAVGVHPFEPTITLEVAKWAANLVERDVANILQRFARGQIGAQGNEINQLRELHWVIKDYCMRDFDDTMGKYGVYLPMHRDRVIQWRYLSGRLLQKPAFRQDRMGATFALRRCVDMVIAEGIMKEVNPMQIDRVYQRSGRCFAVTDLSKLDC